MFFFFFDKNMVYYGAKTHNLYFGGNDMTVGILGLIMITVFISVTILLSVIGLMKLLPIITIIGGITMIYFICKKLD